MTTEKKNTPRSWQKVILRRPVPFRANEKDPQYLTCYVLETLECGHEITVHPGELEPLTARKRNCHKCAGWFGGLKLPEKKARRHETRHMLM